MSGHSKWATIKHKKGAADKKRGKLFAKLIKQVEVAARQGGGDLDANPTLRTMFQKARDASVPIDTIERAIKRGIGELEGVERAANAQLTVVVIKATCGREKERGRRFKRSCVATHARSARCQRTQATQQTHPAR